MLPQSHRIPRKMFPLLKNGAKAYKNSLFLLKTVDNNEKNSRFCFSVSKKVAKNAVIRNRLRRQGYDFIQKHLLEIKPNTIALFSFKKVPQKVTETNENIEKILKESKLIPLEVKNNK